jgi:hypothetical protein
MNILSNTLINTKNIPGLNIHNSKSIIKSNENQQQQQPVDTNVDNYSVNDILTIFNLVDVDEPTLFQIKDVANNLIARMKSEGKMDMAIFFEKAKQKVITEIERDDHDNSDSGSDSDSSDSDDLWHFDKSSKNKVLSSVSSLIGNNWWEEESPIKSQHSRDAPQPLNNNNNNNNNNKSIQMIEYEKNIILEKLKLTEFKLREMEKENKKLRKQVKLLSDR